MPHRPLPVLRRTTFAAAPLLALAGCEWGPDTAADGPRSPGEPSGPPDADQVSAAVAAIRVAEALVSAVTEQHIGLSSAFAPLSAMHAAHVALLDADPESEGVAPRVSSRSASAWKQVVTAERKLVDELAGLAGQVSSGELARALAAMAAGTTQRVAELPPAPTGQA